MSEGSHRVPFFFEQKNITDDDIEDGIKEVFAIVENRYYRQDRETKQVRIAECYSRDDAIRIVSALNFGNMTSRINRMFSV